MQGYDVGYVAQHSRFTVANADGDCYDPSTSWAASLSAYSWYHSAVTAVVDKSFSIVYRASIAFLPRPL
jgi:hypothetical protein